MIPAGACRPMNTFDIHPQAAGADRRGGGALRSGAAGGRRRLRSAPAPGGAGGRIGCWLRVAGYTPFSSHVVPRLQETIGRAALRSYPVVFGAWSECAPIRRHWGAFRNVWTTKDTKPREKHERVSRSFVVFVIQTLRASKRLAGPCARWRCRTPQGATLQVTLP